ncbi:HAD-IIB family hydrolase [[Eubacterium] hominis]|uniref:HAD-IIB family hydrolase n=1 Tax=[Eubacterium] hominis TaxID=2764325 RepID=UPI003A4DDEAA
MKKKLVICDIDDTLIVKHEMLSERAKTMIQTIREQGIYFGIASGRSLEEVKRMVRSWGFEDLDVLISLNGSVLWDGVEKKEHRYFIMKKEWIKEVIDIMSRYPTINTLMYKNDQLLCSELDELAMLSAKSSKMDIIRVKDISDFYQEDQAKIMFRVHEEDMKDIEHYFQEHPSPNFRAFKTQPTLLEFSDIRVSKAYTLQKFCEFHQIKMGEVLAFGDTSNDNDMLQASGWGVCLKNGSADTKMIANEITEKPCDEDGWADYMEHHFFQEHQ